MSYVEYEEVDYDDEIIESVSQKFVSVLFEQIPEDSSLYISDYIELFIEENIHMEFFNWEVENDYPMYYARRFILNSDCRKYLLKDHNATLFANGAYFCHYMIRNEDKIYVVVFDGCHFDIDSSIHIPEELIQDCEKYLDQDFYFSNPVTL